MREMQLREDCPVFPGMCRSGSQEGPIVDTMINDRGGRLYLSKRVVDEAAALRGFVTAEEYGALEEENARLRTHAADLEEQLAAARAEQVKVVPVTELAALVASSRGG